MKEYEKEKIAIDQIIAGAILKFGELEPVDFNLIVKDFININHNVDLYFSTYRLYPYIIENNEGILKIQTNRPINNSLQEPQNIIEEKLKDFAGNIVLDYFDKVDNEEFKKKKEQLFTEQKSILLNNANILLISDNEEDYNQLVAYGFKNINFFKSIIIASKYFKMHPKELENYHLLFEGHQSTSGFKNQNTVYINDKIIDLCTNNQLFAAEIIRIDDLKKIYMTHLSDKTILRGWSKVTSTFSSLIDKIIECAIINDVTEKIKLKQTKFKSIKNYVNPSRLALPTKKSDLQILYLDMWDINSYSKDISEKLGLNITFKEDNNYGIGNHIISNLGEYDIIIASDLHSNSILRMRNESTEQCKETGRKITLLLTYDHDMTYRSSDITNYLETQGYKVTLRYVFGGDCSNSKEKQSKQFNVLKDSYEFSPSNDCQITDIQSKLSAMNATIEQAVNIYNEELLKIKHFGLRDLSFKTAEEYDEEYNKVVKSDEEIKAKQIELINTFDSMKHIIDLYLAYRNSHLIYESLPGLKITETENMVHIENIYQGRTICAITIKKYYAPYESIREFSIESLTKKGTLGKAEEVGIYKIKYKNVEGIIKHASESQISAIMATKKKVESVIVPLIQQAEKNKQENSKKRSLKKNPNY